MALATTVYQGKQQFSGAFTEMWEVYMTGLDFANAAVGSGTFASIDVTVPGLALGDMLLGVSIGVDTVDAVIHGAVTAANTLTLTLLNNSAGAIDLASTTGRALVGRPAW